MHCIKFHSIEDIKKLISKKEKVSTKTIHLTKGIEIIHRKNNGDVFTLSEECNPIIIEFTTQGK